MLLWFVALFAVISIVLSLIFYARCHAFFYTRFLHDFNKVWVSVRNINDDDDDDDDGGGGDDDDDDDDDDDQMKSISNQIVSAAC